MTKKQFIEEVARYTYTYAKQYGIVVYSPIIAQACLESAYGTSELAKNAHNYFGLKYTSAVSGNSYYVKDATEQRPDGSYYTESNAKWCKFNSLEEGVRGYFEFINKPRYAKLKGVEDPEKYLQAIKDAGYSTSIQYVNNVMNTIKSNGLDAYDVIIPEPDKDSYFRVQVGAFTIEANAKRMQQDMKNKGFECIIKQYGNLFKCQTGAYSSLANAKAQLAKVIQAGFIGFIKNPDVILDEDTKEEENKAQYIMKTALASPTNYVASSTRNPDSSYYIVWHYTGNDGDTDEANAKYFQGANRNASAHYFVDDDSVTISVPENHTAWTVGGSKYSNCSSTGGGKLYGIAKNTNTINIEICDTNRNGKYEVSDKTFANAVDLTQKIMARYNISIDHVIRHFDVTGKNCPAWATTDARWSEIKSIINK